MTNLGGTARVNRVIGRVAAALVLCGAVGIVAAEILVAVDLRPFELPYIARLFGWRGAVVVLLVNASVVFVAAAAYAVVRSRPLRRRGAVWYAVVASGVLTTMLLVDWVFLERPLVVRVADAFVDDRKRGEAAVTALQNARARGDITAFARAGASFDEQRLAVILARVIVNRPVVFEADPLVATLVGAAERFDVPPALTLGLAYTDSFYGEAVSGPMPYFAEMNGETFRDLVQVHLPWWFIEHPLRVWLVQSDFFNRGVGDALGLKLRYALQKATYDVSVDPFDTNIYSDGLLVLREYEEEFSDVLRSPETAIDRALAASYSAIRDSALLEPCEEPYRHPPYGKSYYSRYRAALVTFARAMFYKMLTDFEFATRVQTLVARHYADRYASALGPQTWTTLPPGQQWAMVGMIRDVYVPNFGRLGYNLYALPELICAQYGYVVAEAAVDPGALARAGRLWRPREPERLWAGATFKLRNLAETWRAATGESLLDLPATDTFDDATAVLARYGVRGTGR